MIESFKKQLPAKFVMLIILVVGAWFMFSSSMNTYPAYVHAWTQTDRLALAQNFQLNGFDFFHPATFNVLTKERITQVDFPIHDYLVACFSSFFKTDVVSTFRWYMLVYSLIGVFFFFKLLLLFSKSTTRSILGASFLFTLPFFVYYQNGFLPSVPSFSNFIIGLYLLYVAKLNHKKKGYILGVLFLTLAALSRAPFLIFLFAFFLQQTWQQWRQKKLQLFKLAIPLLGLVVFVAYYLYNKHLAATYGSRFLSEALYFKSWAQFTDGMAMAFERWSKQLLSPFHSVLFLALLFATFSQRKRIKKPSGIHSDLSFYLLISSMGVFLFFLAFGVQFIDHDYYYIDSFLPILSLLLLLQLSKIEIPKKWYTPVATVCGIFFFYFFSYAKTNQEFRYTPPFYDRVEYAYKTYVNAKKDLQNWGVTAQDTLYILEANSTNMPFTIWGYQGFTNFNSTAKYVSKELDSNFTYAVLIDSFFVQTSFKDYPELIYRLDRVNSNGELSLYKKSKTNTPDQFFENLISYTYSDFDQQSNLAPSVIEWNQKTQQDKEHSNSLVIGAENEFALSIKDSLHTLVPNKAIRLLFLADYYQTDSTALQVVCRINDYYHTFYTENEFKKTNEWEQRLFSYQIDPRYFKEGDEISFYFWNPAKQNLLVDNVKFLMYQ